MGYKVIFKVKGKSIESSYLKTKNGRFGALGFKKHLGEVYGKGVKVKIIKFSKAKKL